MQRAGSPEPAISSELNEIAEGLTDDDKSDAGEAVNEAGDALVSSKLKNVIKDLRAEPEPGDGSGESLLSRLERAAALFDEETRLGVRSHAKGTFLGRMDPGKELETAQMHRVAADNLIVNITFAWEHAVAITRTEDANALVSHRFPQYSFNDGQVPKFYEYLIKDERFRHHLWLASPGGAGCNRVLKTSEMLEYELFVPQEAEQKQIGELFASLDNLITLHQRKLAALRNLKSALLDKMFV